MTSGKVRKHHKSRSRASSMDGQPTAAPEPVAHEEEPDVEPVDGEAELTPHTRPVRLPVEKAAEQRKSPRCPRCGGALVRRRRNVLDRLRSLAGTVHRYRCGAFGCGWEGVLPATPRGSRRRSFRSY